MLGTATREQQEALWDYGVNIGMAFQIVDDLLDFTGEQQALGKPVGGDLRELLAWVGGAAPGAGGAPLPRGGRAPRRPPPWPPPCPPLPPP